MSKQFLAGLAVLGFIGAVAPRAGAQAPPPSPDRAGTPAIQLSLAPPGARSLAMGASFIGLADDATAAESNPAGLTVLTRPEVSGQLRFSEFENELPNTVTGSGFETFSDSVTSPSFFSVVYPWKSVAIAGYYQRNADFKQHSRFEGPIRLDFGIRANDVDTTAADFRLENMGASLSYKINSKVSVGAGVRRSKLTVSAFEEIAFTYPDFPGFANSLRGNLDGNESKLTYNVGVLLTPSSKFSIGAVYKKGADFSVPGSFEERNTCPAGVPCDPNITEPLNLGLTWPDLFGGGIAFRPTDRLTLLADVVSITYSDLTAAGSLSAQFGQGGAETIEDAVELHVGAEYVFSAGSETTVALRAGGYTDPDHDGLAGVDSDQVHVTFGGGVVLGNRVQIDGALNIAPKVTEGIVSFVLRF
jgi:long-chain fatty acid transport protein